MPNSNIMITFLISAVFFCGIASLPHGLDQQTVGIILRGPNSSVVIRGPDGSVITADSIGGWVSVDDNVVLVVPGSVHSISPGNAEPISPGNEENPIPGTVDPISPGGEETPLPGTVETPSPGSVQTLTPGISDETEETSSPGTAGLPSPGNTETSSPGNQQPTSEPPENSSESNEEDEGETIEISSTSAGDKNVEPLTELPPETPAVIEEIELNGPFGRIAEQPSALVQPNKDLEKIKPVAEKIENFDTPKGIPPAKIAFIPQLYGNPWLGNFIIPGFPLAW